MERISKNVDDLKTKFFNSPMGTTTGFYELDQAIHGLLPQQLVVVGGYASVGKTSLLADVAIAASKEVRTSIFSLEMPILRIQARLACAIAGLNYGKVRAGKLSKPETERFNGAIADLKKLDIYIDDYTSTVGVDPYWLKTKNHPIEQTIDHVLVQEVKKGTKLVLIDYLQLINPLKPATDKLVHGTIAKDLRDYAKKYNICVVLFTQLKKADQGRHGKDEENPKPNIDDIIGSSEIRAASDVILLLHRPQQGKGAIGLFSETVETDAMFLLLKNRDGTTGEIPVEFVGSSMSWRPKENYAI